MKLSSLKIVKDEKKSQRAVAAIIEDAFPPPIHAVSGEPMSPRSVRHLNVDEVLARSLPKMTERFEKAD